ELSGRRDPDQTVPARRSLHAEGALGVAGEELAHEGVVGVEELLGRAGLDDAALPEHGDVLGDPPRGHDVVGDDGERPVCQRYSSSGSLTTVTRVGSGVVISPPCGRAVRSGTAGARRWGSRAWRGVRSAGPIGRV